MRSFIGAHPGTKGQHNAGPFQSMSLCGRSISSASGPGSPRRSPPRRFSLHGPAAPNVYLRGIISASSSGSRLILSPGFGCGSSLYRAISRWGRAASRAALWSPISGAASLSASNLSDVPRLRSTRPVRERSLTYQFAEPGRWNYNSRAGLLSPWPWLVAPTFDSIVGDRHW